MERIYDFLWNGKKTRPPRNLAQFSIWRGRLGILDIDSLSKNKSDSRVIKSHQCSLEISLAVSIKLTSEF